MIAAEFKLIRVVAKAAKDDLLRPLHGVVGMEVAAAIDQRGAVGEEIDLIPDSEISDQLRQNTWMLSGTSRMGVSVRVAEIELEAR